MMLLIDLGRGQGVAVVRVHVLMVCRETATMNCGSNPCVRGMLRYYHTFLYFFDVLLAFRAGTCRRNGDGVYLLACGIGGVSATSIFISFAAVTISLFDASVPTRRRPLSSTAFVDRLRTWYSLRHQAAPEAHRHSRVSCSSVQVLAARSHACISSTFSILSSCSLLLSLNRTMRLDRQWQQTSIVLALDCDSPSATRRPARSDT